MRRTGKYLITTIALLSLMAVLLFVLRWPKKHAVRLDVPLAHDTCACSEASHIVVLRVTGKGGLTLGSDKVQDGQLVDRLRAIYSARAERVLYLFPENDAPFPRVAEIVGLVQHLQSEPERTTDLSKEPRAQSENMNIQIRLVTPQAIAAPCADNCFNWAVKGFPMRPVHNGGTKSRLMS